MIFSIEGGETPVNSEREVPLIRECVDTAVFPFLLVPLYEEGGSTRVACALSTLERAMVSPAVAANAETFVVRVLLLFESH